MSAKSRKSSPASDSAQRQVQPKRGAFSVEVWKAARKTAAEYQIIVVQEDGEWYGRGLEMPNVFADGETVEACIDATREAMAVTVAYLLEAGKTPPSPAQQGLRTQQVNVRLTADEKALLEARARSRGFSGLSDFIRAVAIEAAR